jgi:hypothetical protein
MGHTRLGVIPKTRKWSAVIATIFGSGDEGASGASLCNQLPDISRILIDAIGVGLVKAKNDKGLRFCVYLLTQIALAARSPDWQQSLEALGIPVGDNSSVYDLVFQFQCAVDDYTQKNRCASDISEMAQKAAGEALLSIARRTALPLFNEGSEDVHRILQDVSKKSGFGELGQAFFGRLLARQLNFYLSRLTASQTGSAKLPDVGSIGELNDALVAHCQQSARIVRDFYGDWYSATEFREGITPQNTSRFVAVALNKIRAEMVSQKGNQ